MINSRYFFSASILIALASGTHGSLVSNHNPSTKNATRSIIQRQKQAMDNFIKSAQKYGVEVCVVDFTPKDIENFEASSKDAFERCKKYIATKHN